MNLKSLQTWLNAHPTVKGGLVVAESAAVSCLVAFGQSVVTGAAVLSKQGLETFGIKLAGAVYLAVKNYFTTQAKAV